MIWPQTATLRPLISRLANPQKDPGTDSPTYLSVSVPVSFGMNGGCPGYKNSDVPGQELEPVPLMLELASRAI